MKKIITTLFTLALNYYGQAQVTPSWVKFSTPSNYANYDVKEVSSGVDTLGNIYTAASMYDTINNKEKSMLVKYNPAGTQQWIKFYDYNATFSGTYVVSLLVDKAGNSYVCGYGFNNPTTNRDFMVIKYDNAGNQIWLRYWDGGQSIADYPTCATFDNAGNIVLAGYANTQGATWDDLAVVKWSTAGTQLWSYVYNNSSVNDEDRALAVATDTNNNVIVTGSSFGAVHREMITIKLNSTGANQWTKRILNSSSFDQRGYSIVTDVTGNSYVTGSTVDWVTMKYDINGTALWTNHYTTFIDDAYNIKKVMLDKYNNVTVVGDAFVSTTNQSDLIVNKLNSVTGISYSSFSYNNAGIDNFTDAALDTNGYVYVTGYFEGPQGSDMSAMVLSTSNTLLWHTVYSNTVHAIGTDRPYKMVLDKDRNIILSGVAETRGSASSNGVDVITLKYNTSATGIHETTPETISMSIYPNPAKDKLMISMADEKLIGSNISIINMLGQIVLEEKINTFNQQLNLNGLTKGMYTLTLKNEKASASKKLIIE